MLALPLHDKLWQCYGPFLFNLMALPSNMLRKLDGEELLFFSRYPT